jgi:hypothetical protein
MFGRVSLGIVGYYERLRPLKLEMSKFQLQSLVEIVSSGHSKSTIELLSAMIPGCLSRSLYEIYETNKIENNGSIRLQNVVKLQTS